MAQNIRAAKTPDGRWIYFRVSGTELSVGYLPMVARIGTQVVLLDLDGMVLDTYQAHDALPRPEEVELCAIDCDSPEDAARVAEWAASHLEAGYIGTIGLAERLQETSCEPISGRLYSLDGLVGVVRADGGTMLFIVDGEPVELEQGYAGLTPVQNGSIRFVEDL